MEATSEPASGSVTARAPILRPAKAGRTNRSIWTGSPAARMCGTAMPWVKRAAQRPEEPPPWMISSTTTIVWRMVPPLPPASSGKPTPSNPAAPAFSWRARGSSPTRSHSSMWGATSRATNSRTEARRRRSSSSMPAWMERAPSAMRRLYARPAMGLSGRVSRKDTEAHLFGGTADALVEGEDSKLGHQGPREDGRGQVDRVEGADRLRGERSASPRHDLGVEVEGHPMIARARQHRSPLGRHGLREEVRGHRTDQDALALDQGEARGQHQL